MYWTVTLFRARRTRTRLPRVRTVTVAISTAVRRYELVLVGAREALNLIPITGNEVLRHTDMVLNQHRRTDFSDSHGPERQCGGRPRSCAFHDPAQAAGIRASSSGMRISTWSPTLSFNASQRGLSVRG
jgi:hypothetical protein